ncbi:MAG: tetratricopeptide repeat protein [Gemmatimonadetes bacterium]|nr:tetratricopeptide repeat protein [Gemmatimonadota bacterium]
MVPSREIEKLQRRWQENPLGLTFAPLAEAYRKEGMLSDALDLLEIGLAQHPAYVPAHIVKGRCLLDAKAEAEAEQTFRKVVELDPENVIALQGLADISERAGRYREAMAHLERLLAFDRSNDEAREQLDRLVAHQHIPMTGGVVIPEDPIPVAPHSPEPAALPEPARAAEEPWSATSPAVAAPDTGEPTLASADSLGLPDPTDAAPPSAQPKDPPQDTEIPVAAIVEPETGSLEIEVYQPVDLVAAGVSEFHEFRAADTLVSPAETPTPNEGASAGEPEAPPSDRSGPPPAESSVGPAVAEANSDLDGLLAVPANSSPETGPGDRLAPVDPPPGAEESVAVPPPGEPAGTPAALEAAPEEQIASLTTDVVEPEVELEPELIVTETMAEIFLRQGHRQLALAVYSQLAEREPRNERIATAVAALQEELRPAPSGLPAFAAVLTGGQSVRGFFEQLLAARRPASQPAGDLSLGAIFGDEAPAAGSLPTPPAADPSYDEFFADATVADPSPAPGPADPAEAASEDLEQFTDWLKGLRR